LILTYEQLKESIRERQGGLTLAEHVSIYEKKSASYKSILK